MTRSWFVLGWLVTSFLLTSCATSPGKSAGDSGARTPAEVNTQLGMAYMNEGMYEASMEKFKKALAQDSRLPTAHASIAILYERLGENDLADKHYRKAHDLKPNDPLILNNYGQFLCRSGRLEDADRMFMKALQDPLYRNPAVVLTNAGLCAEKRPDIELAEKYFRLALDKDPEFQPALRQMARITFAHQQYLATRAYLQRLQVLSPLTAELLWIAVRAESEMGDNNAASSYALLLKNRFPESEQAQALVAWERKRRER